MRTKLTLCSNLTMALAFIEDGAITKYPIGLAEVRRKFPNSSFPRRLEGSDLSAFGVVTVEPTTQPSVNLTQQKVEEGAPALVDGVWKQVWNVIDLSAEELEEIEARKIVEVRSRRNGLLSASDWTQVADAPVDAAAWAAYRAELRAVPEQAGFPNDVVWPTEPAN